MIRETIQTTLCTIACVVLASGGIVASYAPVQGIALSLVALCFGATALLFIEED